MARDVRKPSTTKKKKNKRDHVFVGMYKSIFGEDKTSLERSLESGRQIKKLAKKRKTTASRQALERKNVKPITPTIPDAPIAKNTGPKATQRQHLVEKNPVPKAKTTVKKKKRDVSAFTDMSKTKPTRGQGPSAQPFAQRKGDFPNIKDPKQMSTRGAKPKATPVKKRDHVITAMAKSFSNVVKSAISGDTRTSMVGYGKDKTKKEAATLLASFQKKDPEIGGYKATSGRISKHPHKMPPPEITAEAPVAGTNEVKQAIPVELAKEVVKEGATVSGTKFQDPPRKPLHSKFKPESMYGERTPRGEVPEATPPLNPKKTTKKVSYPNQKGISTGGAPEEQSLEASFVRTIGGLFGGDYTTRSGVEGTSSESIVSFKDGKFRRQKGKCLWKKHGLSN